MIKNKSRFSFNPIHHLFKIQSERFLHKTEDRNFLGKKSITQWWYFDCMLDDGSILVFLFTPYQWWSEHEAMPTHKSIVYVSYLTTDGYVSTATHVFDANEVHYSKNKITSPTFTLERAHVKGKRSYSINFNLEEAKGSVNIQSAAKAFSPFPGGSMGELATKYILKRKGANPIFRYAAHVPHGDVKCDLVINEHQVKRSGSVYHEQGMFRGSPHEMGKGWAWFHFVSKSFNVFGTPEQFFCFQHNGEKVMGGVTLFDKGCVLTDIVYDKEHKHLMLGGKLTFESNGLIFKVKPKGKQTAMMKIPSLHTSQLWGTSAQHSTIHYYANGETFEETGWLLLETCKMGE